MLTDTRQVVNALVVVLFLTMMVHPNIIDISIFVVLFAFMYKIR